MECHIFAGTRGRELKGRLPSSVHINVYPGRRIRKLGELANRDLENNGVPKLAYFIPDLSDLTVKKKEIQYEKNRRQRYCEIYFSAEDNKVARILEDMQYIVKILRKKNCTVVFSTFVTTCFDTWNEIQYRNGQTTHLRYRHKYPEMQLNLNEVLHILNREVDGVNRRNGVCTPFLDSFLQKGQKQGYKYDYSRFTDGIHLVEEIVDKWVEYLIVHIDKNIRVLKGEIRRDRKSSKSVEGEESVSKKKRYE